MVLIHALAATDLAKECVAALAKAGIDCGLDLDPGIDVLGGPGLRLSSDVGEDLETAVLIIKRKLEARR